jgi:hypothetical protein
VLANSASDHQPQGLEALPCELLDRVMEFLPPQSAMSLRQVSRLLAIKIPLDDRFWRRHFCSGSLLPHLWDLDEEQLKQLLRRMPTDPPRDWRSLACLFRNEQCLKWGQDPMSGNIHGGLWNRCRIWSIVEEACASPNIQAQSPVSTSHHRHEKRALKIESMRALSVGILAIMVTLIISHDLQSLGLLSVR